MKRVMLVALCLTFASFALAADAAKPADASKTQASAKTAKPATAGKDPAMQHVEKLITAAKVDKSSPTWRSTLPKPTVATFDPAKTYYARMTTTKGEVLIKFLPNVAPMHVTSFMYLTKLGYYDGLAFHRVITSFMAQGGCPLGNGTGGPGYQFDGEFKADVKHTKPGLLSMANAGPGTDGSQFFLTFVPTPWLDGKHTIFGEVVEGMPTLKALEAVGSQSGKTSEPLKMDKVVIEVK